MDSQATRREMAKQEGFDFPHPNTTYKGVCNNTPFGWGTDSVQKNTPLFDFPLLNIVYRVAYRQPFYHPDTARNTPGQRAVPRRPSRGLAKCAAKTSAGSGWPTAYCISIVWLWSAGLK